MYVLMSIMSTYCRHTSHEHRAVRADHVHQLGFMPRWGSPGAAAPLLPPAGYPGSAAASADATPVGASGSCGTAFATPSCWQRALSAVRAHFARGGPCGDVSSLFTGRCEWRGSCGWSREWLARARVLVSWQLRRMGGRVPGLARICSLAAYRRHTQCLSHRRHTSACRSRSI